MSEPKPERTLPPTDLLVPPQKDVLIAIYNDMRAHARHAETLRAAVVNFTIAVASALIAVITADNHVKATELPVCVVVTLVGVLGLVFAANYDELYHRNWRRARVVRAELDRLCFAPGHPTIADLLDRADDEHHDTQGYRYSRRVLGSTHRFWLVAPTLVIGGGLALTVMAL
ncbi:MAG TPA: hypothetical protein VF317_07080 [Dermatophilaceae bacterium]